MEKRELLAVVSRYAGSPSTGGGKKSETYHSMAAKDAEATFLQSVGGKQLYAPGEAAIGAATAGMPDPIKILSLNQTTTTSTTELYMANKGIKRLHPNFKKFTSLAILFLGDNELTTLVGLLPEGSDSKSKKKGALGESGRDQQLQDGFLPEHVRDSSTFKFIQSQQRGLIGGGTVNSVGGGGNNASESRIGSGGQSSAGVGSGGGGAGETSSTSSSKRHMHSTNGGNNAIDLNATLAEPPAGCRRLKKLFLSGNKLTSLEGDLKHLKYLETLLIANNNLSNMAAVVDSIKHLRFLTQLDLFGNPLCEEQHYRLFVINSIAALEVLDRSTVTPSERRRAKELFGDRLANYETFLEKQGKAIPDAATRQRNKREGRRGSVNSTVSDSIDSDSIMGGGGDYGGGGGVKSVPMTLSAINSADGVGIPKHLMKKGYVGKSSSGGMAGGGGSQYDTPRSGYGGGGGQQAPNSSTHILHASGKSANDRAVGFGSTFAVPAPIERAQPISASVANLEMKCTLVRAEEAARKRRDKDRQSAEIYELQDQRRKFHQLWEFGASQGASTEEQDQEAIERRRKELVEQSLNELVSTSSKRRGGAGGSSKNLKAMQIAAEEQQRRDEQKRNDALNVGKRNHLASLDVLERNVSRLFNVNTAEALDPRVSNLIDLQRRREETGNVGEDEAANALTSQITDNIHHLLPPRDGDGFESANNDSKNSSLITDRRIYTNAVLTNMMFPTNLSVLRAQFDELGGTVSPNLLPTFLQVGCAGGVLGAIHDSFFAALSVAFPPVKKKDNLDLQLLAGASSSTFEKGNLRGTTTVAHPPSKSSISPSRPNGRNQSLVGGGGATSTSSSSSTFRTLPLDTILEALVHFVPAVLICFANVEDRALSSLQKHEYSELKPLQKRKNNLHTHLEALKAMPNSNSSIVVLTKFPRLDLE